MNAPAELISVVDLVLAAALLLAAGGFAVVLRLGLERDLLVSATRMIVQLLILGAVLRFVFVQQNRALTAAAALVMLAVATFEFGARQQRTLTGFANQRIGAIVLTGVAGLVTVYTVAIALPADPWYGPQTLLPIFAMVLAGALAAASLALDLFLDGAARERAAIEAQLSLGATRRTALADVGRRAIRAALLPVMAQTAVAGVVAWPGMMTGQLLTGVDPAEAARIQIVLLLVLAAASIFASIGAVVLGALRITDARHRLRLERIVSRRA
jgi:putative ABC transport system permease protein